MSQDNSTNVDKNENTSTSELMINDASFNVRVQPQEQEASKEHGSFASNLKKQNYQKHQVQYQIVLILAWMH